MVSKKLNKRKKNSKGDKTFLRSLERKAFRELRVTFYLLTTKDYFLERKRTKRLGRQRQNCLFVL